MAALTEEGATAPRELDVLAPRPFGWKVRLVAGLTVTALALVAGLGFGQGYVAPNPLHSDFEADELVVSPIFGQGEDVLVQFAMTNSSHRDVRLLSLRFNNPRWARIGSFAERVDQRLIHDGQNNVSAIYYFGRKKAEANFGSQSSDRPSSDLSEFATSGFEELPIEVAAGETVIVAFVAQATDCEDPPDDWGTLEADFEFADRFPPISRVERFSVRSNPIVEAFTPDELNNPDGAAAETTQRMGLMAAACEVTR